MKVKFISKACFIVKTNTGTQILTDPWIGIRLRIQDMGLRFHIEVHPNSFRNYGIK